MFDFECLHLGVNYEEECPLLLRSLHMCVQAEYRWYPCFLSEWVSTVLGPEWQPPDPFEPRKRNER